LSTESVFDFYFELIKGKSKKTGEKEQERKKKNSPSLDTLFRNNANNA
jgi:hypothetical protein